MKGNTHSLLQGPFYMDEAYTLSLIPSLIRLHYGENIESEFNEQEAQKNITSLNADTNNISTKNVAIIEIKQPIVKFSDGWYGFLGSKSFMNILSSLEANESVAGVVFDIDSGGGQVYGTPEFYDYIINYSKPTVAYTDGYMCSAAYYIASACDFIIANKRADHIGSIGAYASIFDGRGFLEKFGGKIHTMYATKSSEKNKEVREVLDNENYEPYITKQLDPIVETFHNDMKASRPNLNDDVFKGATWNGVGALDKNLVDELGTLNTAITKVFELTQEQNQNSNINTLNMNTKDRPNLQGVLGLDEPLASNDNGCYLNDEQLDTVEQTLASNATAVATAQAAQQTAETNLAQEQQTTTDLSTQLKNLAVKAGVEPGANNAETITALSNRIAELNIKPGAVHTTTKKKEAPEGDHSYIDFEAKIYQN